MVVDNVSCVILNTSYEPLSIVPSSRALCLVLEGKASVVEEHPDLAFRSARARFPAPTQVVLKEYKKSRPAFRAAAQLTQRNLFIRDNWTCGYCGTHKRDLKKNQFLTRDHIEPMSKGGRDIWTNVMTACNSCNNVKADIRLANCDMKLRKQPNIPTVFEIWSRSSNNLRQIPAERS